MLGRRVSVIVLFCLSIVYEYWVAETRFFPLLFSQDDDRGNARVCAVRVVDRS